MSPYPPNPLHRHLSQFKMKSYPNLKSCHNLNMRAVPNLILTFPPLSPRPLFLEPLRHMPPEKSYNSPCRRLHPPKRKPWTNWNIHWTPSLLPPPVRPCLSRMKRHWLTPLPHPLVPLPHPLFLRIQVAQFLFTKGSCVAQQQGPYQKSPYPPCKVPPGPCGDYRRDRRRERSQKK